MSRKKELIDKIAGSKARVEATTEAAEEFVNMEVTRQKTATEEQRKREELIAQCHKAIGQVQTADMFAKFATVSSLVWLQQVKSSKVYKDVPGVGTWEKFCNYVGMSRQKVDEDLSNLASFGESFLTTCQQLSVGYRELRKLRSAVSDGQLLIEDNTVEINGSRIPLDADHTEDLQAEIEALIDANVRQLEERDNTLKAKDRVLEEKERVIQQQETEISKLGKYIKEFGLAEGEEALLDKLEKFQLSMQGYATMFNPEALPPDISKVALSKYLAAMDFARRIFGGCFDTANDIFGTDLDDDWQPRDPAILAAERAGMEIDEALPCHTCPDRKAMANSRKGVKIPQCHGKCTRKGGLCAEVLTRIQNAA